MYKNFTAFICSRQPCCLSKFLLIMKLTFVLLTIFCLQASANVFAQKVTLKTKNAPVEYVFEQIRQQTGYDFLYNSKDLKDANLVSLDFSNLSLNEALDQCFINQPLTYSIENTMVLIKRRQKSSKMAAINITGRVTDDKNLPLQGASVKVVELNRAVVTKADGSFSIAVEPGTYTLEVSYISFQTKKVAGIQVRSSGNMPLVVKLMPAARDLDQVVVTALGIKKDEKSLGYSVQVVDGKEVTAAPTNNMINALAGKVAGLNLNKIGGPLGTSDVVLRGDNVLALGSSGALIVVDGVPISTGQSGTGHNPYAGNDSPIDFGSSLSDLNPETIESISVLKGPGAAALYGSRAANGAIIITTKAGRKLPGFGIYVNQVVSIDEINRWPDFQFEYGAGTTGATYYSYGATADGSSTAGSTQTWGPRFLGQPYFQYNSPVNPATGARTERVPWLPYENAYSGVFRTGYTATTTVGISGQGFSGGVSYLKNEWILPNTGFDRISSWLSASQKVSTKVTLSGKVNYNRKYTDNLPSQGYNNQAIMYFLPQTQPNTNPEWLKPMWTPGKENVEQLTPFWAGIDNPFVILNTMTNASDKHNVNGNINAGIQFNKHLNLALRSGLDFSYEFRSQQRPKDTYKFAEGMYRQQNVFRMEANTDFLLKYNNVLPGKIKYTASIGGNQRFSDYKYSNEMAERLSIPGVYNLANSKDPVLVSSDKAQFLVNSLYGFLNFDYKGKVFLELTGRNDWSTTLPENNQSFFYPSVNTSFLLDQIFKLPSAISLAKIRASYSETGVDAKTPYRFNAGYNRTDFAGGLQLQSIVPNPDLKPQFTKAFETGLDLRLFKSRLGLDVALYKNNTINQIINLPIDNSSGYTTALSNVGRVVNWGMEVQLRGTPIKRKFQWDVTLNWAANRNKVMELNVPGSGGMIELYNVSMGLNIVAEEGRPLGQIYGLGLARSPEGKVIHNSEGYPVMGTVLQNLGSINPDWNGSILNKFTWKGISMSALIDIRQGGDIYSLSHSLYASYGKLRKTLPGREDGIIGDGVQFNAATNTYVPNDVKAQITGLYYNRLYDRSNIETNLFSASYIKLREVTVNYSLPKSWLKKSMLQDVSIGLFGRELFNWTKFPGFDPETASLNSAQVVPGIEIAQFPSARTIGMNVRVSF